MKQHLLLEQGQRWFLLPFLLLVLGVVLLSAGNISVGMIVLGLSVVVLLLVGAFKIVPVYTQYNDQFKRKALYSLLEDLYPHVYYAPDNYVPSSLFVKAQLYPTGTTYTGKDYVEGETLQGNKFKLSELSVNVPTATLHEPPPIFKGMFWVIDLPQPYNSPVYVVPFDAELPHVDQQLLPPQTLGHFLTPTQHTRYAALHAEFAQGFTVYSQQDTKTAQEFFKAPLTEALFQWYTQWACKAQISIIGQQLFIALPMPTMFPVPDMSQKVIKNTDLNRFYDQFLYGLSVVESFGAGHTTSIKKAEKTTPASDQKPKTAPKKPSPNMPKQKPPSHKKK